MYYKKKDTTPRSADTLSLKEGIEALLDAYHLRTKFHQTQLVSSWDKIMGGPIASRTEKLFIKDKKLFIKLNSAPLKQELSMSKTRLIQILNGSIGEEVINEIIFI